MQKKKKPVNIVELAQSRGRRQARRGRLINMDALQNSAEQFEEEGELYIQTYCLAHQQAFDELSPTERIIRLAKNRSSKKASKGFMLNEKAVQSEAQEFNKYAPLYVKTYLITYQNTQISKKQPDKTSEEEMDEEEYAASILMSLSRS